jgi:hypothetical protein
VLAVVSCKKPEATPPPLRDASTPIRAAAIDGAPIDAALAAREDVLENAVDLVGGLDHTCALLGDGKVACWGRNRLGVLGNGDPGASDRPVLVRGIDDAIALASDNEFACALRRDGRVACWGKGGYGNLGAADTSDHCFNYMDVEVPCALAPVEIAGLRGAVAIDARDMRACAVDGDGRVWCWGRGIVGAPMRDSCTSGRHTEPCARTPVAIRGIDDAVEIAIATQATCYRTRQGKVRCWGEHWNGELGDGTTKKRTSTRPVEVVGIDDAVQLAARSLGFCVRRATGEVHCWGDIAMEGLGDGSRPPPESDAGILGRGRPGPVLVDLSAKRPLSGATDLAERGTPCAARGEDGLWCWGTLPTTQLPAGILPNDCPGSCVERGALKVGDATVRRYQTGSLDGPCALFSSGRVTCRGGPVRSVLIR